jgi:hypothetical protein
MPWLKPKNRGQDIQQERESTPGSPSTRNHMIVNYELTIWISGGESTWSNEYRFVERPAFESIHFLLRECEAAFADLYSAQIEDRHVSVAYLCNEDRVEIDV